MSLPPDETRREETRDDDDRAALKDTLKRSRRMELLTLFGSGFVGAMALAVSTYNVYLQRVQIRAQVWPHLSVGYNSTDGFELNVENSGVGPAIVKWVEVRVNDTPVKNWPAAWKLLAREDPVLFDAFSFTIAGVSHRVLGPGATLHPLHITVAADTDRERLVRDMQKLQVEVCYCSTLGDCWLLGDLEPIRSCPAVKVPFEE